MSVGICNCQLSVSTQELGRRPKLVEYFVTRTRRTQFDMSQRGRISAKGKKDLNQSEVYCTVVHHHAK